MCKTRKSTLVSQPQPQPTMPRSTPTRRYSATTNSSTFIANPTSSFSTASSSSSTSLSSLPLDNPTLIYPSSELSAATNHFRSKPPFITTLRSKPVLILPLSLPSRPDPLTLPPRLSSLSKSHHSSLLPLLGASIADDHNIYLVYQSVSAATTLKDCLRNSRNPDFTPLSTWISRIQIAADLADGLDYIHNHCSTIHNRIKSSNIIVTDPDLRAKICYFGAADLAGEVETTKIYGARGYIAPEVIAGGRVSEKSDVYAFGVVVLELVSGREPVKYTLDRGSGEYGRESVIETAREAIGGNEDEERVGEREEEERMGRVRRWVDRRLRDSFPVEVVEGLVRVALRCVEEEAFMRPKMTAVAGSVSKLYLESRVWDETVRVPTEFSVTIGPR